MCHVELGEKGKYHYIIIVSYNLYTAYICFIPLNVLHSNADFQDQLP